MENLNEILHRARREGWAMPHFNISNLEILKAITEAALEARSPLLIGTSEGEQNFLGLRQSVALVQSLREEYNMPFYLNADHMYSVETAKRAVDAGYDSVHIDLSKKSLAENTRGTKEVVEYARSKNPLISVEGEIGYFVTDSSKVYKEAVEVPMESLAKPEEAVSFAEETKIDRLAPVIGGIHGVASNAAHLDIARIEEISRVLPNTIFVLHGGSGDDPEEIRSAIKNGISNVHISTDLRVAYVTALRASIATEEYAPYKIMKPVVEAIMEIAIKNIRLFGSDNKV